MPSSSTLAKLAPILAALLVASCVNAPQPAPTIPAAVPSPSAAPTPMPSVPIPTETPSETSALQVQIVYPAGSFTKVRAGLRTQADVPPEDLTMVDLERLQVQLNGKDLAGYTIVSMQYDAATNLVVTLAIPVSNLPATGGILKIALPGDGIVLYVLIGPANGGRVTVGVDSTAHVLLDKALQAVTPPRDVSPADREALLSLVKRRVFNTLTASGSGNIDRSQAMSGLLQRITAAVSQDTELTVDNLKKIETPLPTTGGGGAIALVPATIEQQVGGSTVSYFTSQEAGQSITAPVSGTLRAFDLWLGNGATVTISIYQVDGASGLPTGTALAEKPGIALPAGAPSKIQTVFEAPVPVTANAKYAVVAKVTAGTMNLEYSSTNQYDGGSGLERAGGGPWSAAANADIKFVAYFN